MKKYIKTTRKITVMMLILMMTIAFQPVKASATAKTKPVVKATQSVISKGTKTQLKAAYGKKNVTTSTTWKSSNPKVATINKKGVVTGKKIGTAYITATYKGAISAKVKITVAQISLSKTSVKLNVGKTYTLTAKYNGKKVKPVYKSSNTKIATVNKNGKITAKKKGTATITAIYKKSKKTCKITITDTSVKHVITKTITKEATCTENGIITIKCSCGDTYTETIPKLGHSYDNGVLTTPPTVNTDGITTYTCKRCNHKYTKTIPACKTWDETVTEYVYICNGCGKIFSTAEYGLGDSALEALGIHQFINSTDCAGYHTEKRTFILRHDTTTGETWVVE